MEKILAHAQQERLYPDFLDAIAVSASKLRSDFGAIPRRPALSIGGWGKRRWQIEGWFKAAKHRFGLHRFGESAL